MKVSDLTLAIRHATLEQVAAILHERFGCSFVPRSSDYLGGEYYAAFVGREEVLVHLNLDGGEVAEEDYADFEVLLQINCCDEPDPLEIVASRFRKRPHSGKSI
ncbi:MAG TPA: hypothetical protein VFW62_10380 [bacterium]|nr:hypothetical protein [bacterium]